MTQPIPADVAGLRADLDQLAAELRDRDLVNDARWDAIRASLVSFGHTQQQQQTRRHDSATALLLLACLAAVAVTVVFTPAAIRAVRKGV